MLSGFAAAVASAHDTENRNLGEFVGLCPQCGRRLYTDDGNTVCESEFLDRITKEVST